MYVINWFDVLIFARLLFAVELIVLEKMNKTLYNEIISRMIIKREM